MNNRPHCQQPAACAAKGAGHCRRCHFTAVAAKLNADPEFAAAHAARMKALHADPEFAAAHAARRRERMKALNAKKRAALGILPQEVDEWRAIRRSGLTGKEAAGVIIRSRKERA